MRKKAPAINVQAVRAPTLLLILDLKPLIPDLKV